ncbi:MAG: dolichol-phosphate mannose synthase [uncultured bacterium]|nr:MAG: dolichol-phosphate mannose synthase [uncultured bacterium]KKU14794.1 MAG: Dolichol-phosphate mannose synthase [Microgenomates group bacterium GW2011_GWC2_45_8]KKU26235.1 MAG: Dolichol-phosphate mannose synthase [Microgenomates group bacterium GW2011_GWA2_46_16]
MQKYIIVPAYNEEKYIGRFLDKLLVTTKKVIVVDDGSRDQTKKIVQAHGVICLSHLVNLGKGAALKTGCDYAFKKSGADAVIIMDGDNQHEVRDIALFERELNRGAGVVLGVRRLDTKMPPMRILGNKIMSVIIMLFFGRYLTDIPSGFKAMTKSAYNSLRWQSTGYEVETEIAVKIAKNKLIYVEVPISTVYHDKDYGFNLLDAWGILLKIPYWLWS